MVVITPAMAWIGCKVEASRLLLSRTLFEMAVHHLAIDPARLITGANGVQVITGGDGQVITVIPQ
jgi:hypothetical protein